MSQEVSAEGFTKVAMDRTSTPTEQALYRGVQKIMRHEFAAKNFLYLPVLTLYPKLSEKYLAEVEQPMDLGTILRRLHAGGHYPVSNADTMAAKGQR